MYGEDAGPTIKGSWVRLPVRSSSRTSRGYYPDGCLFADRWAILVHNQRPDQLSLPTHPFS